MNIVPRFKLTTNGGRSELQRGVGGPNRKPFYAAWASFVRMAFTSGGTLFFTVSVAKSRLGWKR